MKGFLRFTQIAFGNFFYPPSTSKNFRDFSFACSLAELAVEKLLLIFIAYFLGFY